MLKTTCFDDCDELYQAAADYFLTCARQAIKRHGVFHVALSGGTTPRRLYQLLAKSSFEAWSQVYFYLTDERCVPLDSDESNCKMIRETLITPLKIPEAHFLPIPAESPEAPRLYARILPEKMDLTLLGMGTDGHIASIFPGTLLNNPAPVWHVPAPLIVLPAVERITLSPETILQSTHILLLFSGKNKLPQFLARHTRNLPVSLLDQSNAQVYYCN